MSLVRRRDARRWLRGRGRDRQYQDAQGGAAEAQGPEPAGDLRDSWRGLHDQGGLPRAQRKQAEGGQATLRQSAQHRGRIVAADRSVGHGVASAALLRLCVGRDRRRGRADAVRHGRMARRDRASRSIRFRRSCSSVESRCWRSTAASASGAPSSSTTSTAWSTSSTGSTGRSGSALFRESALGDRAQVRGGAGDHGAARHRHPGRPHRRADAGRQAGAGHGRRRGGAECLAAQRGLHQGHRQRRRSDPRRHRHPDR